MKLSGLLLFAGFFSFTVHAEALDLNGKFAFDWFNATKSKCQKIDIRLAKKLSSFKCVPSNSNFGGDDKPALFACKSKAEDSEFMVYETKKDCNLARETTLANGD